MTVSTVGRVEVDVCQRCGARWFDRTELAAALAAQGSRATPSWGSPKPTSTAGEAGTCPRDRHPLIAHQWLGAEFGRCSACQGVLIGGSSWQLMLARCSGPGERVTGKDVAKSVAEIVLEVLSLGDW